jgi:glutamine synthetase
MPRREPSLTVDSLRRSVADGSIDTVVVAFPDMQGRLQGKRLHAQFFLDHVLEHNTEGCNYLMATDVDMNTVDGYAISSWDRGYGDMEFHADLDTLHVVPWLPGTAMMVADMTWLDDAH